MDNSRYIEATEEWTEYTPSIFLAGGISGTINWQPAMAEKILFNTDLAVVNPRRSNWTNFDDSENEKQINWEYLSIQKSTAILFWFPAETLCPIALFELGIASQQQMLFIGHHPDYKRAFDLKTQMSLYRPDVHIVQDLDELASQVIENQKEIRDIYYGKV